MVPSISGSRSRCTPSRLTSAPTTLGAGGDLVDLVEEDDAVLLHRLDRLAHHLLLVEQLVGLLGHQHAVRLGDGHPLGLLGRAAEGLGEHLGDVEHAHLAPGMPGMSKVGSCIDPPSATWISISFSSSSPARSMRRNFSRVSWLAFSPTSADEHALLGRQLGLGRHLAAQLLARHVDGDLDQVAHDLLDVAADIADLGELGGLDLEERRLGELGQPAGDLGLADAGGADHQDVLRQHLLAHAVVELLAPPAVAQRDGDRALGVVLADDVAVELGDDFARREAVHKLSTRMLRLV